MSLLTAASSSSSSAASAASSASASSSSLSAEPSQSQSERVWFYTEGGDSQRRGPVPASVLHRLCEKGIGVSAGTLVWRTGMDQWLPIGEVPEFKELVEFQNAQWYYLDRNHEQRGPCLSRFLLHKLRESQLDGLSLVFSSSPSLSLSQWTPLGQVPQLKREMQRMVEDEEALLRLQQKEAELERERGGEAEAEAEIDYSDCNESGKDDLVFVPEEVGRHDPKKCFLADDGLRYQWDDEVQNWVLLEEEVDRVGDRGGDGDREETPLMDDEDADGGDSRYRKRKHIDRGDPDSEIEYEDDEAGASTSDNASDSKIKDVNIATTSEMKPKKKRNAKKKKGPNLWVYITGLPVDITLEEIRDHFSKVGIIAISPYDQQPRIKIYKNEKSGDQCKGDASLCYLAPQSVQLAIDVLNGGYIRPSHQITVTLANFEVVGTRKQSLSQAQIKVARNAAKQALAWNDEDDGGINKSSALRIIVLEGMFQPSDFVDVQFEKELEVDVARECEKFGAVDKITIFANNPRGIIIVKFVTAFAAQECVKVMNGRFFGAIKIRSYFWDGSTNYSMISQAGQADLEEKEEAERLEGFGTWLDDQQDDLPEEFKLQTEEH